MKYFFFIIFFFIIFGCSDTKTGNIPCINSITYTSRKLQLISDLVEVNIIDKENIILKKMNSTSDYEIIFYCLPEEDRQYFIPENHILNKGFITLQIRTGFFNSERGRKVWKSKEVEDLLLRDSIGVVVGKDTIIIKKCN